MGNSQNKTQVQTTKKEERTTKSEDKYSEFRQIEIKKDDLTDLKELSKGNNGNVYTAIYLNSKVVAKEHPDELRGDSIILQEVRILMNLRHPSIVLIFGVVLSPRVMCVTEFLSGGDLEAFIKNKKSAEEFPLELRISFLRDIGRAMIYLHSLNVIHRDIAARNILLDIQGGERKPKIGDFGRALELPKEMKIKIPFNTGPFRILSPEVLESAEYSFASDIWSFGVLMYVVMSRRRPYHELNKVEEVKEFVKSGKKLSYSDFEFQNESLEKVFAACLEKDQEKRMETRKVMESLFP